MSTKKRSLAAIMFTDIVGYTLLMQENEGAAIKIRKRHRVVFNLHHERYNGQLIQYYGDGTLSIFLSAVEAVCCAIEMQKIFISEGSVPLRIGIHMGDLVHDETEVYGDGVNLASRIESMGIPGSILISDKLAFEIKNHESIGCESLGFFHLKNIKDEIQIFAISNEPIIVPHSKQLKGKFRDSTKSVAVLPFANMSADPENEYFSDGITEEILNALVKVEGLHVTARTSSFSFKGKNLDIREIGQQLNVSHVLEGSVRKVADRVRITAQLIKASDGFHLFSESYDRSLDDIFGIQDEIAQLITHRLRQHLGEEEYEKHLVQAPTKNIEAYETYLKGLYYYNQWGDEMGLSIPYFLKAIEIAPDFALPHTRLILCYFFQAFGGFISWQEAHKKGEYHIQIAQKLNAEAGEFYFGLFVYHFFVRWDWFAAYETVKKGLRKFPNFSSLHHAYSSMYWLIGNFPKVVETQKIGLALDPLSVEMNLYMGSAYFWNADLDNALKYYQKTLELNPKNRVAKEYMGWISLIKKEYQKALAIFELLEPTGYRLHRSTCLACLFHKTGKREKANEHVNVLLNLYETSSNGIAYSFDLSIIYAWMGEFDQAISYLKTAIENRIGSIQFFDGDPLVAPLKNHVDYKEMVRMLGEKPKIVPN